MDSSTHSIKKLYYSIGEVSKDTELKQYVLRYWETEFKQLKPSKGIYASLTGTFASLIISVVVDVPLL